MLEKFLKIGKKNMEYNIKLAEQFLDEFEEICEYISNKLKNIDASNRLREKVIYNVLLLEKSLEMCMVVNNYVILYTVDELEKIVYIAHIYYGGRNYLEGGLL